MEPLQTAQEMSAWFTDVLHRASVRHIPRGARADAKPWALDPELRDAIAERQGARRLLRQDDPASKTRWIEAKRRAASVERSVSQAHFRDFDISTLNKPASMGRIYKILKKWEGAPDEHRPGEAMEDQGRLLVTDSEKASALNRQYAAVSRQIPDKLLDRAATRAASQHRRCTTCDETCGIDGNERADEVAREEAALPQALVPVDVRTVHRAAAREARDPDRAIADWTAGWHRDVMENRMPPPVAAGDSSAAVDVHQCNAAGVRVVGW